MTDELFEAPRRAGPSAQMTAILVSQGRLEEKLTNVNEKLGQITDLTVTVDDHEKRIIKIEGNQGIASWVWNAAFGILVAAISAGAYWFGGHHG